MKPEHATATATAAAAAVNVELFFGWDEKGHSNSPN